MDLLTPSVPGCNESDEDGHLLVNARIKPDYSKYMDSELVGSIAALFALIVLFLGIALFVTKDWEPPES